MRKGMNLSDPHVQFLKRSFGIAIRISRGAPERSGDGPMISRIAAFAFEGVDARPIDLQVQLPGRANAFNIA